VGGFQTELMTLFTGMVPLGLMRTRPAASSYCEKYCIVQSEAAGVLA
jgi:hypothetical protein